MFRIRFFEKKRGEHRTMSETGSRIALAVIFAVLAAAGAGVLAIVLNTMTIAEWRANHEFIETRCTLVSKRVAQVETDGLVRYRPEFTIRYSIGGQERETTAFEAAEVYMTDEQSCLQKLEDFAQGGSYPCWYDPQDPSHAVVERGYSWYAWLIPLLPASFVAVGVGGLIYLFFTWGKSLEHRTLLGQSNVELFETTSTHTLRFPTVPDDANTTNSAGTTLRYRVPYVPAIGSFFLTALAVLWNAATLWFVWRAIAALVSGEYDSAVYSPLLIPFVAAGGYLAYLAGRGLLVTLGVEPTVVELSDHPLLPGGKYELYVAQGGHGQFKNFSVSLVCDEEATFRQGTNSRTHTHRVQTIEVFRREGFATDRQSPFAERVELRIPEGAMHSFQTRHNAVKWKLLVRAQLHKWPDVEREFSVVVGPPPPRGGRR